VPGNFGPPSAPGTAQPCEPQAPFSSRVVGGKKPHCFPNFKNPADAAAFWGCVLSPVKSHLLERPDISSSRKIAFSRLPGRAPAPRVLGAKLQSRAPAATKPVPRGDTRGNAPLAPRALPRPTRRSRRQEDERLPGEAPRHTTASGASCTSLTVRNLSSSRLLVAPGSRSQARI